MKIKDLIQTNAIILKNAGIESYMLDSQLLLAHILGVDKQYVILNPNKEVSPQNCTEFAKLIKRREKREPLQYIVQHCEFFGMNFFVDENVLIPRPDTETLMEQTLSVLSSEKSYNILEIGTGSGAIAVALGKHLAESKIYALDISENALKIAERNATQNNISNINFAKADIFDYKPPQKYDLIISNPPYIEASVCRELQPEVSQYEPRLALDGGDDGLDFYRRINELAQINLTKNGFVSLEIGENQEKAIEKIFDKFALVKSAKDLSGIMRALIFQAHI